MFQLPLPTALLAFAPNYVFLRQGIPLVSNPDESYIEFRCPRCFLSLRAHIERVGAKGRCPTCQWVFTVPNREQVSRLQADRGEYKVADGSSVPQRSTVVVVCPVCHTRIDAPSDKIGREVICPDCDSPVLVAPPIRNVANKLPLRETGEYILCEEVDDSDGATRAAEQQYVAVYCKLCNTLMQTPTTEVGREIVCLDCGTANIVAPPVERSVRKAADVGEYALREEVEQSAIDERYAPAVCPTCGTRLHARLEEVGRSIICPDCDTRFAVPEPPPKRRRPDPRDEAGENYKVVERAVKLPPFKPLFDINRRRPGYSGPETPSPPPRWPFVSGVFTLPWRREVRLRWFYLSVWLAGLGLLTNTLLSLGGGLMAAVLMVFMYGTVVLLGAIFVVVLSANCLSILLDTAAGNDRIENWPSDVFLDWMGDCLYVVAGLAVSIMPGGLAASLISGGYAWGVVGLASALLLFPIVLLSMLEADSPLTPLSSRVMRSMPTVWQRWLCFYALTIPLTFVVAGLLVWLVVRGDGWLIPAAAVLLIASVMIYFRLLGRLACCSDASAANHN